MTNTWKIILNGRQIRLVNNLTNELSLYINGKRSCLKKRDLGNRINYIAKLEKIGELIISKVKTNVGEELRLYHKQNQNRQLLLRSVV